MQSAQVQCALIGGAKHAGDVLVQLIGNFRLGDSWREAYGRADANLELAGAKPAAAAHFELAQSAQRYGKDGRFRLLDEKTDTGPKWSKLP